MATRNPSPSPQPAAIDELPKTAEEVDLDRVVWDPAYRQAVLPLLERRTMIGGRR
jgi:hypothetical protein